MFFLPWHLAVAYGLDLLIGDPQWLPHPTRWIGRLIIWAEDLFYDGEASPSLQRFAGFAFWMSVIAAAVVGTIFLIKLAQHFSVYAAHALVVWMAYVTLSTRSLHRESSRVIQSLRAGDLATARAHLAMIVSRETGELDEKDILRAVIETVAENISDGIIAPLAFLAVGGPVAGIAYKTVNTMDSMIGYKNDRYRYFGSWAARVDDMANWIPARLSGILMVGTSACLKLDWRSAWQIMRRDARKMKSPNAGFPEAAAAGALSVQLGGTNIYFGEAVAKPTLGDDHQPLTVETYTAMIRLMYLTSFLAFVLALGVRFLFI
jgi:adenosylcobinamide-phosphate synthase